MGQQQSAFEIYLRRGRKAVSAPVEHKFNPYHDPENGQFTFAPGGATSSANRRIHEKLPRPERSMQRPSDAPFREAARRIDAAGQMARETNAFVNGQRSSLNLLLGGDQVVVQRLASREFSLASKYFTARGTIEPMRGRQEVVLNLIDPKLSGIYSAARLISFPRTIRIFQSPTGKINYEVDRDTVVSVLGVPSMKLRKGTYVLYQAPVAGAR